MLDEKLKAYMDCETCWKTNNCTYYQDVEDTIKKFKNTPLNIHFPSCKEHESYYYKVVSDIEALEFSEEDRESAINYFNENKDEVTKIIEESFTKYMLA